MRLEALMLSADSCIAPTCDPDFIREILRQLPHFILKKNLLGGGWDMQRGGEEKEVNSTRDGRIRKDFTEES